MASSLDKSLCVKTIKRGGLKQRFELVRKLGQGTYGKVQLGVNRRTGAQVALKTIRKSRIENDVDLLRIKREINIMSSCTHPNIIRIYEVFENREKIILVMEYASGGELYDYLNQRRALEEEEAKRLFAQIASAIFYCHMHNIVHRDLKLENILLDLNSNAKIGDFGLSNICNGDELMNTFCGSPLYSSPEIVQGIPYHGPEVDCWSLGVLLYTLIYGSMPFDGSNFKKLVHQITTSTYYEPPEKAVGSDLIRALLTVNPEKRLNIDQTVKHPWLQSTHCHSVSEEYCKLGPIKSEYLQGISSSSLVLPPPNPKSESDTLDEVSEISLLEDDQSLMSAIPQVTIGKSQSQLGSILPDGINAPTDTNHLPQLASISDKLHSKPTKPKRMKKATTERLGSILAQHFQQPDKSEAKKSKEAPPIMTQCARTKEKRTVPSVSDYPVQPTNSFIRPSAVVSRVEIEAGITSCLPELKLKETEEESQSPNVVQSLTLDVESNKTDEVRVKSKSTHRMLQGGTSSDKLPYVRYIPITTEQGNDLESRIEFKSSDTGQLDVSNGEIEVANHGDSECCPLVVNEQTALRKLSKTENDLGIIEPQNADSSQHEKENQKENAEFKVKVRKKKLIKKVDAPTSVVENGGSPTNPTRITRRNSRVISQKTAELIQNLKETTRHNSSSLTTNNEQKKLPIFLPSLNDVRRKFEKREESVVNVDNLKTTKGLPAKLYGRLVQKFSTSSVKTDESNIHQPSGDITHSSVNSIIQQPQLESKPAEGIEVGNIEIGTIPSPISPQIVNLPSKAVAATSSQCHFKTEPLDKFFRSTQDSRLRSEFKESMQDRMYEKTFQRTLSNQELSIGMKSGGYNFRAGPIPKTMSIQDVRKMKRPNADGKISTETQAHSVIQPKWDIKLKNCFQTPKNATVNSSIQKLKEDAIGKIGSLISKIRLSEESSRVTTSTSNSLAQDLSCKKTLLTKPNEDVKILDDEGMTSSVQFIESSTAESSLSNTVRSTEKHEVQIPIIIESSSNQLSSIPLRTASSDKVSNNVASPVDESVFESKPDEILSPDDVLSSLLHRVRGLSRRIKVSEEAAKTSTFFNTSHGLDKRFKVNRSRSPSPSSSTYSTIDSTDSVGRDVTGRSRSPPETLRSAGSRSPDLMMNSQTFLQRRHSYLSHPHQSSSSSASSFLTLPRLRFQTLNEESADDGSRSAQQETIIPSESMLLQKAIEQNPDQRKSKFLNRNIGKLYWKRCQSDGVVSPSEQLSQPEREQNQPHSSEIQQTMPSISDRILRKSYYTRYNNHLPHYKATKELSSNITKKLQQLLQDI